MFGYQGTSLYRFKLKLKYGACSKRQHFNGATVYQYGYVNPSVRSFRPSPETSGEQLGIQGMFGTWVILRNWVPHLWFPPYIVNYLDFNWELVYQVIIAISVLIMLAILHVLNISHKTYPLYLGAGILSNYC